MSQFRVRSLEHLRRDQVRRLVPGFRSEEVLVVQPDATRSGPAFRLEKKRRPVPYERRYPLPARQWGTYRGFLGQGASLGAYEGHRLVGLALVERREAERALWIWEFGVLEGFRRRGIGTALLEELLRRASASGYRTIGLETQTTNVPAVEFYLRNGFGVSGTDPTLYPARLSAMGEVALFLERSVPTPGLSRRRANKPL